MANGALALINSFAAQRIGTILRELDCPGHFVRIDIKDPCLRIKRRSTPLSAAIEPWKDNRVLSRAQGNELTLAAIGPKLLKYPLVRFRRAVGQHVFRQPLARIRRRLSRKRLRISRDFTLQITRRVFVILNREQWLSICSIEYIDEALLSGLRDRINSLAIVRHRDECRRRWKIAVPQIVPHALEMPDAFAGFGIQRQFAVSKKVVSEDRKSTRL